jgi:hypothetical protein
MKKLHILTWVFALLCFYSCKKDESTQAETAKEEGAAQVQNGGGGYYTMNYSILTDSNLIPIDTANKMISSYIKSLQDNDGNLHSLILNAETLRQYLKDSSIKEVKVIFAHKLSYINSGHEGEPAGLKSNALTIILAGYRSDGTYVLSQGYKVPNRARPCPNACELTGNAANDFLQ